MTYSLPELLDVALTAKLAALQNADIVARIWSKDARVWTNAHEAKWLGWLTIADEELAHLERYREFAENIGQDGFKDILLMGMGGSSLCPEVLALTFNRSNFHILDSTVPSQVQAIESKIDIAKTLFIVASKSGSTLEPNCFKQYFFDRVVQTVGKENAGKQFVAITDPGSKMEAAAKADGFRHIFYGKPEIGGRYSALSAFGLTAAASMGLDIERLLGAGSKMSEACRNGEPPSNPGLLLGSILGICHGAGRDKLTIFTSPEIHDLGAWLEQLIAESTGKNGVAIIPVDREPLQPAVSYGDDRVFVHLKFNGSDSGADLSELFAAGHPVIEITINDLYDLGAEFFRWEFATAVAGAALGINPFDEPNVSEAKEKTKALLGALLPTGRPPESSPTASSATVDVFSSRFTGGSPSAVVRAALSSLAPPDYVAFLSYLPPDSDIAQAVGDIRAGLRSRYRVASTFGIGPRYLHSTGQYHKGGPDTAVAFILTADDATGTVIPEVGYTFSVLKRAQALGDTETLEAHARRTVRIQIKDAAHAAATLERLFAEAMR